MLRKLVRSGISLTVDVGYKDDSGTFDIQWQRSYKKDSEQEQSNDELSGDGQVMSLVDVARTINTCGLSGVLATATRLS